MAEMAAPAPFVGLFELDAHPDAAAPIARAQRLPVIGEAWHIQGLLTPANVQALLQAAQSAAQLPVGRDGIRAHYTEGDAVGSLRCSAFDERWAAALWACLRIAMPARVFATRMFTEFDHVDWAHHPCWTADGVNPLMRFIRYRAGEGELVAHYDAPYVQSPTRRTLFSVLLYLTDNEQGGATRFLRDGQAARPFHERNFADWPRAARTDEVAYSVTPRAGDALVFEHRLLHDGQRLSGTADKWVLRTDMFFNLVDGKGVP